MDFVNKKTEFLFNDLGEQKVKNTIVHAFDLENPDLEKRSNIDENTAALQKLMKAVFLQL